MTNPGVNTSMGRYGKTTTGVGQGGYNPPNYSSNHYGYGDKSREEGKLIILQKIIIGVFFLLKILIWLK